MNVNVRIQEVLAKTIQIEIPNEIDDFNKEKYIDGVIEEMYSNSKGKSILSLEDFTGYVEINSQDSDIIIDGCYLF